MVDPADTPFTIPFALTVAIVSSEDFQNPPSGLAVNVTGELVQMAATPLITGVAGAPVTLTTILVLETPQLLLTLEVLVAVPAAIPLTSPEADTVATDGLPDDQVPPAVLSVNWLVVPVHTVASPLIAAADAQEDVVPVMVLIDSVTLDEHPFELVTTKVTL